MLMYFSTLGLLAPFRLVWPSRRHIFRLTLACLGLWQSASPYVADPALTVHSATRFHLCENAGRFIVNASEKYGLVTHYSTNGLDSACGRSSQTLVSTAVADDVSCKSCQRSFTKPDAAAAQRKTPSLAELRKSAKVAVEPVAAAVVTADLEPAAKVVNKSASRSVQTPARAGGFSTKAAWAARLAEQSGQSRLPRGMGKQRHV